MQKQVDASPWPYFSRVGCCRTCSEQVLMTTTTEVTKCMNHGPRQVSALHFHSIHSKEPLSNYGIPTTRLATLSHTRFTQACSPSAMLLVEHWPLRQLQEDLPHHQGSPPSCHPSSHPSSLFSAHPTHSLIASQSTTFRQMANTCVLC